MRDKEIIARLKMQIPGGYANPSPPVGPALGQHGANIAEFCREFNRRSGEQQGMFLPVEVTIFEDRSFQFQIRTPITSDLIKKCAGLDKGSGEPGYSFVGKITRYDLREIAKMKMPDLNTDNVDQAMKTVAGTARSMGVEVVDE